MLVSLSSYYEGTVDFQAEWQSCVRRLLLTNLPCNVSYKQNGYERIVLSSLETQVRVQRIEFGIDQSIPVEEVEEVHDPKDGLEQVILA